MATWTDVSSTVLEPGDPIRSVDIIAIKENIIALSEGASGAPKVLTAAINDEAVTSSKLATGERMNTTNVLSTIANASVGAVGTYAFLVSVSTSTTYGAGNIASGSALRYGGVGMDATSDSFPDNVVASASGTPSGTWQCMGRSRPYFDSNSNQQFYGYTLWLRIS